MIQTRMLTDLAGQIVSGAGYARALVDGAWTRCERYNASVSGGAACVDFRLPDSGQVTRMQVYSASGSLWEDRAEDFTLESGAGQGNLYRVRYALSEQS